MAVHQRNFRRYQGPITPQGLRFLVLPHYLFKDIFKSKLLVFFYAICFLFPLGSAVAIYMTNNLDLLKTAFSFLDIESFEIGPESFGRFLFVQGIFYGFLLTLFVGPGLISRDLANNGLPLYLSRPISRGEYVLGKASVLFILLSGITWIPGLMLYGLQGSLDEGDWMARHFTAAVGMTLGAWVWIVFLSLLALAFSAWVKWKPVAAFMMFMVVASGAFFAMIINLLFFGGARERDWGHLVNPIRLIEIIWSGFLGTEIPDGPPLMMAWMAFAAMTVFLILVLNRKLRAYEVVT